MHAPLLTKKELRTILAQGPRKTGPQVIPEVKNELGTAHAPATQKKRTLAEALRDASFVPSFRRAVVLGLLSLLLILFMTLTVPGRAFAEELYSLIVEFINGSLNAYSINPTPENDESSASLSLLPNDLQIPSELSGLIDHPVYISDDTVVSFFYNPHMLVGGMPQSVLAYIDGKNFAASDEAKRRILKLYRDDVSKFAPGYEEKIYAVFDGIPGQLSKKEKKYKLSSISKNARFRAYEDSFIWLNEAMVVNTCFNATDPNVGLALSADNATQKCYMADTGLLVTQTFMDRSFTDNELYRAILFDKLDINEGMIMENIVAQMLRRNGHKLYFYSRSDSEHRENHMEIDFLITEGKKIAPIEVKSGNYRSHASLDKFRKKYSRSIGTSYILYPKDVMKKDGVWHLPLYMAMFL